MGARERMGDARGAATDRLHGAGLAGRRRRLAAPAPPPRGRERQLGRRRSGSDRRLLDAGADARCGAARRRPPRGPTRHRQLRLGRRRDGRPLRRQRPHLHPPGRSQRLLLGHRDQQRQSRRLVLTAGHCVNTGPRGLNGTSVWSRFLEFVPAYTDGTAPFGAYVAHRAQVFAPKHWIKQGNPNFDIGAALVTPIEGTVNVADAVGGVTIALNRSRKEEFQTFGYPGESRRLQRCDSPSVGDDKLTYAIPGPPTLKIRCHWLPGASGGGWLIGEGHRNRRPDQLRPQPATTSTPSAPTSATRTSAPLVKGF